ncbi:MAG: hypothetical protein LC753_07300 [Acidobacteria bacterium]|nr:hypothetical protein [Acidobacteriota bacterium]
MSNPLTMKSWSPYVVGVGIGMLSWFAFASANKHLAITLQFEHVAALTERAAMPDAARRNPYYAVRAAEGKSPKVSWDAFATAISAAFLMYGTEGRQYV